LNARSISDQRSCSASPERQQALDQRLHAPRAVNCLGDILVGLRFELTLVAACQELAVTGDRPQGLLQIVAGDVTRVLARSWNVNDLKPRPLFDLVAQMKLAARPHFKGGFTAQNRVVVANNGFYEYGDNQAGLFEFDGKSWNRLSDKPHMDVAARQDMGTVLFATGWDEASVLFWALVKGKWQRFRLPKASQAFSQAWQTEWMRIREVETEHYLVDIQGMFYELQPIAFQDHIWGMKPICQHLRTIPDYCSFRGLFAVGGNQTTPNRDNNAVSGQPQSGIWFGKTDDLWSWGKPAGWGGPWWNADVRKDVPSDPYLMTGFDKKMLHVSSDKAAYFRIEIDFMGMGDFKPYERLSTGAQGYAHHIFPAGFSAHWVRLTPETDCRATAAFFYT
jgi:hypothetical protein